MALRAPGIPGSQLPPGEDHIMRRLAEIERAYRELIASTVVKPGSLGNDAITPGSLGSDVITPGSLTNDTLTSPVAPGLVYRTASNFSLSTTLATLLTATITVPPGFTQCAVSMSSRVYVNNPNTTGGADGAGADYVYTWTGIAGLTPLAPPILVRGHSVPVAADTAGIVDPYAQVLSGLTPGGTFDITAEARTIYAAWASSVYNTVELSGSLLWFR